MKKRVAIITGATGGIGKEFVKALCMEDVDEIWSVARNLQKLEELRKIDEKRIISIQADLSKDEGLSHI